METAFTTSIIEAKSFLEQGAVVAIPTETVYGLAANALDESAVMKIFEAKQRPHFDPLIVHLSSASEIEKYAVEVPDFALQLAEKFMPGPLTLLLKKKNLVPDLVTSGLSTVGLRVPAHPLALELLNALSFPLAAPSANPFGYISPTSAAHVYAQLAGKIPLILDGGDCSVGVESTIVEVQNDVLIIHRVGGVSLEELNAFGKPVVLQLNQSSNPSAPGKLASHYAPRKPLHVGDVNELIEKFRNLKVGIISFEKRYDSGETFVLSAQSSLNEAAKNLFKALRYFDKSNCEVILAEVFPNEGIGMAINDRLKRAAAHQ